MEKIKLQKYFTDCGILSRRAAEKEIADGNVKVNGQIAELGLRVDPDNDLVEYDGRVIRQNARERLCIMLNKPTGFVTTLSDEKGRRTVTELTRDLGVRVYPIGRLDMNSDGLLLLTDDGELANRLTHPKHDIPKIYHVTIKGRPSMEAMALLRSSMVLDGYRIQPVKTDMLSYDERQNTACLRMELYEGRNRQIRKMCSEAELKILRLTRVAYGELSIGDLPTGKWRRLTDKELDYLRGNTDKL